MAASPPPPRVRQPRAAGPLRWVRRYFGYSRSEARGMVVLLALMLAAIAAPLLLRPPLPTYLPAADQRELNELVALLSEHRTAGPGARYPPRRYDGLRREEAHYPPVARVQLAPFDPNALTAEGWEARGVPHFVAARLVKYGAAAGGFRAKAQIKKAYGLEDSVYQRLAPFLQLPDEVPRRGEHAAYAAHESGNSRQFPPFAAGTGPGRFPRKPRNLQPFDLNTADTTQLMQIRGIGSGRARGVVRYRNQLGGFLHEDQLAEVFVLRDAPDLQDSLRKYTFVTTGFAPQVVHVNAATFDELYLHPYIGKPRARLIVAYRQQHGPFKQVEDLRQIPALKAGDWEKLRLYVRCD